MPIAGRRPGGDFRTPVTSAVAALNRLGLDPALVALAEVILKGHEQKEVGIAQGGALSPLILNLLLHYTLDIAMTAVQTLAMVAAAAVIPAAVGAIGKKQTYVISGVVAVAAAVGFALAPGSSPWIAIACYGILGLVGGGLGVAAFLMARNELEDIAAGFASPSGQGMANAAKVMGIIGMIGGVLAFLSGLAIIALAIISEAGKSM